MATQAPPLPPAATGAETGSSTQAWPSPRSAWYAMAIFAVTLMFLQVDRGVITLLVRPIKKDLNLTDVEMSYLLGASVVLMQAFIGVPLARLVDSRRRNILLGIAIAGWSAMTALCGLAQNFVQLFLCRCGVGVGDAINGPATYSMIADYFPREKLPRAISVLQLGFIAGGAFSLILGGAVIALLTKVPDLHVAGLVIRTWQMVFFVVGLPGLLVGALMAFTVKEPARRGLMIAPAAGQGARKAIPFRTVIGFLLQNWKIYLPMFLGLAIGAVESAGTLQWRPTFFERTYGWSPQQIGLITGSVALAVSPIGLVLGTWLTEFLAKRRDDANLVTVVVAYVIALPFQILGPLMPTPWLAIAFGAVGGITQMMSAAPQNAAIQAITPNEMRGQVTALYLFVFSVIGQGLGPTFIALITDLVLKDESQLKWAMSGSAMIMGPIALVVVWLGVAPYGRAITRVKQVEQGAAG